MDLSPLVNLIHRLSLRITFSLSVHPNKAVGDGGGEETTLLYLPEV